MNDVPPLCWQHETGTICPHPLTEGAGGVVQCGGCEQPPALCSCGPQEDGEVIGLSESGTVIQWAADTKSLYDSCQSVQEFGVHNLYERELPRVGVDRDAWAALRKKVVPLPYTRRRAVVSTDNNSSPNLGYLG